MHGNPKRVAPGPGLLIAYLLLDQPCELLPGFL